MTRRHGFTLIELLVVVTIIVTLVAILLPSLARAQSNARALVCTANLHQMQIGWQMCVNANAGKIPYTRQIREPHWTTLMIRTLGAALPSFYGTNARSVAACPEVHHAYHPMYYANPQLGYAVNTWWRDGLSDSNNDLQPWSAVRHPSTYPWFVDPQIYAWGDGFNAAHRVPYTPQGPPDWGVGANHDDGNLSNMSFADGSARAVPMTDIRLRLFGPASFPFFENR
ncbi:MAG: prepilin-type N-terminal cleavage/methylation domain-containing protein [Planctomycetes bacterium]|nr:prepilin-type N-terminal cleavage/methylation domain-containing protein [Planctomycetota bacterium]